MNFYYKSLGLLARFTRLLAKFTRKHYVQWRAEVWWCPGRLLDCIPPTKFY